MMKAVLLENELYISAMTVLTELKGLMEDELIDYDEAIETIEFILNLCDTAAAVAGQNTTEDGTQFEIVNADPETYMDVETAKESGS